MLLIVKLKRKILKGDLFNLIPILINKIYLSIFHREVIFFNNLVSLHEYQKAYTYALNNSLLKFNNNLELIRRVSLSAYYSGNKTDATKIFGDRVKLFHGLDKEQISLLSRRSLPEGNIFNTEYVYYGGYANSGFLLHKNNDQNLLCKIIPRAGRFAKNKELHFYLKLTKCKVLLEEISPKFISHLDDVSNNFLLLTTVQVQGFRPNNSNIDSILDINKKIESIGYKEALCLLGSIGLDKDKTKARHLHNRSTNVDIFHEIKHSLKLKDELKLSLELQRVELIIVKNKLYKFCNPDVHYAFSHNDVHKNNIIAEDANNCKVIDWNSYTVALRGWDMCYYFGNFEFKFKEIKYIYIDKFDFCRSDDLILAKIFYTYLQIYIWIMRLRSNPASEKMNDYFLPAIDYIEKLYCELNNFEK